jgi:hypothetical protein
MYKIINVTFEHNSEFLKRDVEQMFYANILGINDIEEIHNKNQIKEMDDVICLTKN